MKQTVAILLAGFSIAASALAQDPQLTKWFTQNSGKYARVYQTTTDRTNGNAVTTWTNHTTASYSDVYDVSYSTNYIYVKRTGLASYVMGPWLNPMGGQYANWPTTQTAIARIPRTSTLAAPPAATAKTNTPGGTAGIYVNGVAIFNMGDGQAWSGTAIVNSAPSSMHSNATYYWHRCAPVAEAFNFDDAGGHHPPNGTYHNHQNPIALRYQLGDRVDYNATTKAYAEGTATPITHSPIVGWAADGYPIYGPYGYGTATDSSSAVRRMVAGYVKRNGSNGTDTVTSATGTIPAWYARYRQNKFGGTYSTTTTQLRSTNTTTYPIGTFAQDWAYLGDLGGTQGTTFDLNEYNARYCVTPEFPSGTWAYFIAIDSAGASTYPYVLGFEFMGAAAAATVTTISESVTNSFTGGPNTPITLQGTPTASGGNVTLTWNSVEGGTYTVENSTNQSSWTTRATGVAATTNATTTSQSIATIGSSGTEYGRVTRTALATYDTTGVGTATVAQTGTGTYTAGANTAPTLTSISTLTGASKNTAFTIAYATLAAAADEADANGNAISFRVEAISSGTLTKSGTAVTAGTTLLSTGETLAWTPATNVTGSAIAAFTVKAYDGSLASSTAVQVSVDVANGNSQPTLTTISTLTGATEETAYSISYTALAAAANEADLDGDTLSFRIEAVSSGTLTKSGSAVSAGTTLLSTSESLVWTPASNANGTIAAFTVTAYDGTIASASPVTVNVSVANVNDAPTLSSVTTLTGAALNTAFTISYATLAAAANEADVDGDTLSFRIESISAGTLSQAVNSTLSTGGTMTWTPATGFTGTVAAFSITAYDGTVSSGTPVAVNITVAAADGQLTSWYTARSGRYARIVETDTELTNDSTKTTWTYGSISQSSPTYAGPTQVDYSASFIYLRTPNLGTYTMGPWYNDVARTTHFVNVPKNQGYIVKLPRSSTLGSIPTTKTKTAGFMFNSVLQQACGWFVDGVAIYDPTDGFGWNGSSEGGPVTGSWHRDAYVNEGHTFDTSIAHQQNTGNYHNHVNPLALRYQLGDAVSFNNTTKAYSETLSPTQHSPIIGWMLDGLPIYGPYGYGTALDSTSAVRRMVGGYVKRDGARTGVDNINSTGATRTLPAWATRLGLSNSNGPSVSTTYPFGRYVQDWAYLGDLTKSGGGNYTQGTDFDLNEYNVRYCKTPEFPNGTWAYFLNISSTGTPQFPYISNIWYYGTPAGGTVTNISETVTNQFTGGPSRPLNITNATVASPNVTLTWNAVEGGTYSVDASSNNSTWTSKATGLTVSNANSKSNTHATLGTSGTEYARVNRTALATYDTTGVVTPTVAQTTSTSFNLGSTPTAPTLTTISALTGATEDTAFTISYAALAAAADEADANGDAISFRIEEVISGTLTKSGTAVSAGVTTLATGESLVWTPGINANGTLATFTVKAYDGALASSTAVTVNVSVMAVNDAPTLTTITDLADGVEDTAYSITFAMLAAAANEADVDGDTLSFRVEETFSGILTKNGVTVVAGTLISSGDTLVFTPNTDSNGFLTAMTVSAWDGALASSGIYGVQANFIAVNDAPTITNVDSIGGGVEDTPFSITYAALAAVSNETDPDGDVLSFRVAALGSGTLTKNGSAVTAGTLLSSGDTFVWTPPADYYGGGTPFTFTAYDGVLNSVVVNCTVSVSAVNDAPTMTSNTLGFGILTTETFSGTGSTFAVLADEADVDGDTLSFRIESVPSGTLTVNGSSVTTGVTTISSGSSFVWTPPSGQTGTLTAMTLKAYDGSLASSGVLTINVTVSSTTDTLSGWAGTYGLTGTNAAQDADPDNDGVGNAIEYVLGRNPTVSDVSTNPINATVSGGYLTLSFYRYDDSENDMVFQVQYGTTLTSWTTVEIHDTSSTSGGVIITVTENGSAMDLITVQIPAGTNTRMFSRLSAVVD
jgi:hypothetical protein